MRQSLAGGKRAGQQPAEPDALDQKSRGGAGLHALFPDEPRPDPDAGGRGALPAHPRGLCRDRGRGGRRHAEPDARARERVPRRERGRAALSAAAGAAGVPCAPSGRASAHQQPFHTAGHRRRARSASSSARAIRSASPPGSWSGFWTTWRCWTAWTPAGRSP